MGLAIDGNVVHGIARGGQAFVNVGNANNADGSINIDGQNYLSENKIKIKKISDFQMDGDPATADITSDLSNYAGYLAIFKIGIFVSSNDANNDSFISQPIIIPTAPTTENASFLDSGMASDYNISLSRTTNNNFIISCYCHTQSINFKIYILSNEAS